MGIFRSRERAVPESQGIVPEQKKQYTLNELFTDESGAFNFRVLNDDELEALNPSEERLYKTMLATYERNHPLEAKRNEHVFNWEN